MVVHFIHQILTCPILVSPISTSTGDVGVRVLLVAPQDISSLVISGTNDHCRCVGHGPHPKLYSGIMMWRHVFSSVDSQPFKGFGCEGEAKDYYCLK